MPEDVGSGVGAVSGAYSLYQGAKATYYAYKGFEAFQQGSDALVEGATAALDAGKTASDAFAEGSMAAAQGASEAGSMVSAGIQAMGPAVGVYAAGAVVGALGGDQDAQMLAQVAMTMALMSGPQAVIGVVVIVVMRFLMGSGCDSNDIMTSNDVASKRCHYVGGYCEKKILGMCVQQSKGFCCFNSILSRIIHEQGRPQLTSFQPGGAWGEAKKPNCRGFTPEEFQSIDFGKIDLSEYYGQILNGIEQRIQGATTRVEATIQGRFEQIQGGL